MGPHDLNVLAYLTESMIGLGRWDEALKIGIPVVELDGILGGELPENGAAYLVKKMADHLQEQKNYAEAVRLWEVGVKYKPEDINILLGLIRSLLSKGDHVHAYKRLKQARKLSQQNNEVLQLLESVRVHSQELKKQV
jgi:tetratricopeptide (TPR) repeat protein